MEPIIFSYTDFETNDTLCKKLYASCEGKLQMVKWLKVIKNIGLVEAKEIVDAWVAKTEFPEFIKIAEELSAITGETFFTVFERLKTNFKTKK